jgi:hypothetical protein
MTKAERRAVPPWEAGEFPATLPAWCGRVEYTQRPRQRPRRERKRPRWRPNRER